LEIHTKRPLGMPEGHFVLYAGHSSNSGVFGHSNGCINMFPYYHSMFKRCALLEW